MVDKDVKDQKLKQLENLKEKIKEAPNLMAKLELRDEMLELEKELGIKQIGSSDQEECLFCSS